MRRHWLAKAVLATVALSVPAVGLTGTAHAATVSGASQQKTAVHKAHKKHPKSHKSHKPRKKAHNEHYKGRHRRHEESFDMRAATFVKAELGAPYMYGGSSPAGFDCSGLTSYVYRELGKNLPRTAEAQFLASRPISKHRAWGGDLVFFHVDSNPNSYVYHVGIYEGGNDMVAATTYGGGVEWQNFGWAGDTVTFGTITH